MSTFVLISGAWHGGWCYQQLALELRNLAHQVYTPTYAGVGDLKELINGSINLSTHIKQVVNLIEFEDLSDVILVGHSYGGFVITGVADVLFERISALVYIDAFVPKDGKSQFDLMPTEYCQKFLDLTTEGFAVSPLPAESFNFLKDKDCELVKNKLTPHPLGSFLEKISLTSKHEKITNLNYIISENWGKTHFGELYKQLTNTTNWKTTTFLCGHEIMIDLPKELSKFLTTINQQ